MDILSTVCGYKIYEARQNINSAAGQCDDNAKV